MDAILLIINERSWAIKFRWSKQPLGKPYFPETVNNSFSVKFKGNSFLNIDVGTETIPYKEVLM